MKQSLIRIFLLLAVPTGIVGCASYDPNVHYDPNAIEKMGRIVEKRVARVELRESGELRSPIFLPITAEGAKLLVDMSLPPDKRPTNIYQYRADHFLQ